MRTYNRGNISLTLRVMVFVGLAILGSLILSGFLVLTSVENHFAELDLGELKVIVTTVENIMNNLDGKMNNAQAALSHAISGHHGVFFELDTSEGQMIFRSPKADFLSKVDTNNPSKQLDKTALRRWRVDQELYHGLVTRISAGGENYKLITAMNMSIHEKFLKIFTDKMWLMMVVIGLISMAATWLGVNLGLKPLKSLGSRIRNIQTNDLDERLDLNVLPTELRELGGSFNYMLHQLEEGFVRLSNFSADIAHELRTPLTNIITMTQVGLVQSRTMDEYRELLYANLEEQERLAKMVNQMLWLAQSDNNLIKPNFSEISLKAEINQLFEFFDALAAEKKINLVFKGDDLSLTADRDLLKRAFSNLLSNAIRHSPEANEVSVEVTNIADESIQIVFTNYGQKIAAEHINKIFDRFYREDPSRFRDSETTGLGLAITKAIIEAHNGLVNVDSDDRQTNFTVTLPVRER